MKHAMLMLAALALAACSQRPTAHDVCVKIVSAGIGAKCREGERTMMRARAEHAIDLDLVHVPGKGAAVMSFASKDDYNATVEAFAAAAMLAGPHRYGNEKALIFVQANDKMKNDEGAKLKAIVDAL